MALARLLFLTCLDFSYGEGIAADGELTEYKDVRLAERRPQKLDSPDILAIKGLGQLWRQGLLQNNRSESFRQFVSGVRRFVHTWD